MKSLYVETKHVKVYIKSQIWIWTQHKFLFYI